MNKTNKKYVLYIILVIIISGFAFWVLKDSESVIPPVEPVVEVEIGVISLLTNLKKETSINFSEIESGELKWVVEVDPRVQEITIGGKGFEAERISSEQYDSVESFFVKNTFEIDLYNMATGTISGLVGYKKDQTVCTVAGGVTGYKEAEGQWIPPEPNIKDIEIKCGKIEPLIGGQRDEHGCLGPAGYMWSEEVNACIRGWELNENQRMAAGVAVDDVGYEKGLTIIQVLVARCPGCFMIEIEKGEDRIKVTLENFKVVKKSLTPNGCIDRGGETVNITGGATCSEEQLNIGDVTGFISPAICCVPAQ